jgi:hypothetical protein
MFGTVGQQKRYISESDPLYTELELIVSRGTLMREDVKWIPT